MEFDNEIYEILKNFYNISGIRVSIHSTDFKETYRYPEELSPFCSLVQTKPEILKQCLLSNAQAFARVSKTDKTYIYKCKCGLFEAAAPVYHYGRITGYLMLGQIRDAEDPEFEKIIEKLKDTGINCEDLDQAVSQLNSLTIDKMQAFTSLMTVIAEFFSFKNKLKDNDEELAALIRKEIVTNYSKDLTLNLLAKKFGCSIGTITTAFKKEYNIGIHQFIINTRLKNASELLKNSNKSIKVISEECGFYDQNHFYRTFKKTYGKSPSVYRSAKD